MVLEKFIATPLCYTVENEKVATLTKDCKITLFTDCGMFLIRLKEGFKWDGQSFSIPPYKRLYHDDTDFAPLVHDVLYSTGNNLIDRDGADSILRGIFRETGHSRLFASAACLAVNMFACRHFNTLSYPSNEGKYEIIPIF